MGFFCFLNIIFTVTVIFNSKVYCSSVKHLYHKVLLFIFTKGEEEKGFYNFLLVLKSKSDLSGRPSTSLVVLVTVIMWHLLYQYFGQY